MKSVLTRSFSRSWLCATGKQNRTNKTNGTHAMAIFLAVNGFAPSRLYFFRAPQRAATLSRQLQQHCLPLSNGRSRMEFGADLLRADGQLTFQGVAHEYHRIDFALQDVTCRGYGLGDDIDILRADDDDDLLAGSHTVRQHAMQFAARRHHLADAGHAGPGAVNLPLKKGAGRSAKPSSWTSAKACATLSRICWRENLRLISRRGNATFSKTFKCGQIA